jgi:hypothetical protein
LLSQPFGTVYTRFAPDSNVTAPLLSTLINLYSNEVPAGRFIEVDHVGLDAVYLSADSADAEAVSQLLSCEMDPTILTVWPTEVVVLELKVTATVDTGVAQVVADWVGAAVVEVAGMLALLDAGGFGVVLPDPEPVILMSAQVE